MIINSRGDKINSGSLEEFFGVLVKKGNMRIESLICQNALTNANFELNKKLNLNELREKNLPGYKMGNLAINSCYIHNILWQLLKDSGLIKALIGRFNNYKYVSFGGNLNLPKSKKQRLHVDTRESALTINIPLIDVTEHNGAVSVIDTELGKPHTTLDIMKKRLYTKSKRVCSKKGDVILRFSSTWHRGNENNSEEARMMLSFTLRETWPWPQKDTKESHLILEKSEDRPIEFSGNIYPDTKMGSLLENLDYFLPSLSFNMIHLKNILRGF